MQKRTRSIRAAGLTVAVPLGAGAALSVAGTLGSAVAAYAFGIASGFTAGLLISMALAKIVYVIESDARTERLCRIIGSVRGGPAGKDAAA